jgi:hypothetical protein
MNEKLITHLIEIRNAIENDVGGRLSPKDKTQNYLYLAKQAERMEIYMAEKSLNGVLTYPRLGIDVNQNMYFELYRLQPIVEMEIENAKLIPISDWICTLEEPFNKGLEKLRKDIALIEKKYGIFAALLHLKRWAHLPDKTKGAALRSRVATAYLKVVSNRLKVLFENNQNLFSFLTWFGDRNHILIFENDAALKVKNWGFNKKQIRNPPKGAQACSEKEATDFIKHFLNKAIDMPSDLSQQYAEMVIYLSLCLVFARKRNNFCQPNQLLEISKENLIELPPLKGFTHCDKTELMQSHYSRNCRGILFRQHIFVINPMLAKAVELLDSFTLNIKGVANHLDKAYEEIGLRLSSGKIAPRCFLVRPHIWNRDARK